MQRSRTLIPTFVALLFVASVALADGVSPPESADFASDVMAVLSRAGCNQGACHGNQNGKGGLKLSLRGQEPTDDHRTLVREQFGRRVNGLQPEQSLLLLKATNQVPHLGGRRFDRDSLEYATLRRWIASGAATPDPARPRLVALDVTPREAILIEPQSETPLTVTARLSDGTTRDVTRLAAFETTNLNAEVTSAGVVRRLKAGESTVIVRYLDQQVPVAVAFVTARTSESTPEVMAPPTSRIDRFIQDKLAKLHLEPSPAADDATVVRRTYLDTIGIPPTAEEARDFVQDASPDKRARLVDRLLARPEFGELWALRWSDLLRVEEKVLDSRGVEAFHGWIRDSLTLGKPLDEFVRDLVTARGSTYANPPANYWRALRDPAGRGETTARLFLGVRLQCAQCHNHPFDRWTQDDYFNWTTLFARIDYRVLANTRRDNLDKNEFNGEQIVEWSEQGDVTNPRSGAKATPRFLGDARRDFDDESRLVALADWLTAPENPLFARTQANFIWYHVMGRGLFEPIDDLRATNPPSNPALLDALADDLIRDEYDLRSLVRRVLGSDTYAVSSQANRSNRDDEANFARAMVRRLPAETLLDAQSQFLDVPVEFAGYRRGLRAGQIPGVQKVRERDKSLTSGDRFLRMFGKPQRLLGCECERSAETTLGQALSLLGDEGLQQRLTQAGNRLDRLARSAATPAEIVDELYWSALSRPPTADEARTAIALLENSPTRDETLQDLAWALVNAKEFLFRH